MKIEFFRQHFLIHLHFWIKFIRSIYTFFIWPHTWLVVNQPDCPIVSNSVRNVSDMSMLQDQFVHTAAAEPTDLA